MNEETQSGLIQDVRDLEPVALNAAPADQRDGGKDTIPPEHIRGDSDGTDTTDNDGTDSGDADGTDSSDADGTDGDGDKSDNA